MNVLFVYADFEHEFNSSYWNCFVPAKAINKLDGHKADLIHFTKWTNHDEEADKLSKEADIIVVERNFFFDTLTTIQFWKVRGKTIIGIFDDGYHIMHPENVSYRFWTYGETYAQKADGQKTVVNIKPVPIEQFKWGLKLLKGIQVVSQTLADDWYPYTDTYYVDNFLDAERYQNVEPMYPHSSDDEIIIGWQGSMSHYSSFVESGLMEALRKIGNKYPKVKFLFGGDKRIFEKLEIKNKQWQNFVPADQFTSLVKSFDIGVAPLSGEFDKRRSWIKVLEYMALGVPWVASDYVTYAKLNEFGILTPNGYSNWVKALSNMIENIDEYKALAAGSPMQFAFTQTSDINVPKVTLPLYKSLIDGEYPNILRE